MRSDVSSNVAVSSRGGAPGVVIVPSRASAASKGTIRPAKKRLRNRSTASPRRERARLPLAGAGIGLAVLVAWFAYSTWGPRAASTEWGPLAVSQQPLGGDTALTSGTLRISDQCVFLEADGNATLLVWPREGTTWDASTRTIQFQNREGEFVDLRDGQRVSLGGSGTILEEAPSGEATSWGQWVSSIEWEAEPSPTCTADASWAVGQATHDS